MEFLTRLFPQVRRLQRDAIRIRSEREEWRQRYTSLQARGGQSDPAAPPTDEAEWRFRIALWSAEQARALPGDFVECASPRRAVCSLVTGAMDWASVPKTFYLVGESDGFEAVSDLPNVRIIRAPVPDALPRITPPQTAWLSAALDTAASGAATAEHFWPRLVSGGIVLLNNYGRDVQKQTWDAFAAKHQTPILPLPTGQGIMVKR